MERISGRCEVLSRAMDQPAGLQVDYVFRGVEHAVRVVVSGQVLELEVEDRMTADQWRGEFDASFIEDLTHKTGNFKQFNIFCNMLESALTQSSEAVTLDLLTYTDLESLRNRKLGGRPGTLAPRSAQLNSKRYLILIYSVEFDRIHYPLPLPYQGKPDPVILQGIIRSLKEELSRLRGLDAWDTQDTRDTEMWHLREQCFGLHPSYVKRTQRTQAWLACRTQPPSSNSSWHPVCTHSDFSVLHASFWIGLLVTVFLKSFPAPSSCGRAPRFDPTAFVKAKEKKQREIKMKQQQRNRLGSGGSSHRSSSGKRPGARAARWAADWAGSSVDSFRNRCSSASSCSEFEDFSESLSRGLRCRRRGKPPSPTPWSGSNTKSSPRECSSQRRLASSGGWVPIKEYSSDHQAADMAEIDARLKALQEYMNQLDTRS
ncbi:coiled-coil domain-containing protein 61 [Fukomys damarensis]|uniref:coiled-coil domain-containing protein 61 n=1 Tax=Fukomys damarensis TaxID=885580 RepID=UPI00053FE5CC|nr:coiled-coil domain-containing protein 61 [Fukomys damarensis]